MMELKELINLYRYIAKTICGKEDDEEDNPNKFQGTVEEPKFLGMNPSSSEKVGFVHGFNFSQYMGLLDK